MVEGEVGVEAAVAVLRAQVEGFRPRRADHVRAAGAPKKVQAVAKWQLIAREAAPPAQRPAQRQELAPAAVRRRVKLPRRQSDQGQPEERATSRLGTAPRLVSSTISSTLVVPRAAQPVQDE